jgi:hypothetical protein
VFCGGPILLSKVSCRALRWHPATSLTNLLYEVMRLKKQIQPVACLLRKLFPAPGILPPQKLIIHAIFFLQLTCSSEKFFDRARRTRGATLLPWVAPFLNLRWTVRQSTTLIATRVSG